MIDVTGFGALNTDLIYGGADLQSIEEIIGRKLVPDSEDFHPRPADLR